MTEDTAQGSSLRDELNKALEQSKAAQETQETTEIVEPIEPAENPVSTEPKKDRVRDENGKFVKQEKAPEPKLEDKPKELKPTASAQPPATEQPKSAAPQSWNAAAKAEWDKLPESVRQFVTQRETEIHKGFTRLDEERIFGKQLKEVVAPYMAIIQSENSTPAKAVQELLNTSYILRTGSQQQKAELVKQIIARYGVDLNEISQPSDSIDPNYQALKQEIDNLRANSQREELAKKEAQQQKINEAIDEFKSNPENVYFDQVKDEMAALLLAGKAKDLADAYSKAIWANPEIRSTLLENDRLEAIKRAEEERKQKVEAAKRAGSSIKGGPGVSVPNSITNPSLSLREELKRNLKAATSV